jgi:7-cyano-7-deazaguanine reductase
MVKPLKDSGKFKAQDRSCEFSGTDAIDSSTLEFFEYACPGRDIEIEISTEEFTSVCPFSGLPDFGRLNLIYVPDKLCVELRSLKYYLMSFRNVGIFYEHLANRIRDDLCSSLKPKSLAIELVMTVRGGLQTTVRAEYKNCKS